MSETREDLRDIFSAIREVEVNLDRRAARAKGLSMLAWGIAASSIFAFYHLVEQNPGPWVELLGHSLIRWAWVGPIVIAYLVNVLAGVRLGRVEGHESSSRSLRRLLLIILLPLAVLTFVSITGRGDEYMPAMWVAFLGTTHFAWCNAQTDRLGRIYRGLGWASLVAGGILAVTTPGWGNLAAALWYAIGLAGLGAFRYHMGE